jgi:predicted RNA-binding Zn ribbon-like protein
LWLVESFLNSIDVETGADDLGSMESFRRWLRDHQQVPAAEVATGAELALARDLRTELRAELSGDGRPDRIDALTAGIPLAARCDPDGTVRLAPAAPGVPGMLGEMLAAIVRAEHEGIWARLKICSSDDCAVVYYDRSKNGSRRWCSMDVCGNRSKTRAYRERHKP